MVHGAKGYSLDERRESPGSDEEFCGQLINWQTANYQSRLSRCKRRFIHLLSLSFFLYFLLLPVVFPFASRFQFLTPPLCSNITSPSPQFSSGEFHSTLIPLSLLFFLLSFPDLFPSTYDSLVLHPAIFSFNSRSVRSLHSF